jgi:large subunit ribosomal protein L20
MARAKRGFKARRRRKKLLSLASGFRGTRKNCYGTAVHVVRRALKYSYRDRRVKKREFRSLWIIRINAAARAAGLKYSELMHGLRLKGIELDRSVLADMALRDEAGFAALVKEAKAALPAAAN